MLPFIASTPPSFRRVVASVAALAACHPSLLHARSGEPAAPTLDEVTVTTNREVETTTSQVDGYRARHAVSATKSDTPLAQTPQSVSIATRDAMTDQAASGLQDALNYASGVRSAGYGLDSRSDNIFIRGREASDQYVDGLRDGYGYYTSRARLEPYGLERVEVLRGPAGMLYGAGSAAGIVNVVSKRPQSEPQREIGLQVGNHQRRQIQADLTGPIDSQGQWLYRLVALGRESGTQTEHVPDDRRLLMPSLTWHPRSGTAVTLIGRWQDDRTGSVSQFMPWSGTILPNPNGRLPRNRFIGEPGDHFNNDSRSLTLLWQHALNDRWIWHGAFRTTRNRNDSSYHYADSQGNAELGPGTFADDPVGQRILGRYLWREVRQTRYRMLDTHVRGRIDAGGVSHRLTAGIELARQHEDAFTGTGASSIDAYDPVHGNPTPVETTQEPSTRLRAGGVYLQDQLRSGRWTAVAGLRHDRTTSARDGRDDVTDSAWTKRLGVMYHMDSGWAPYLSYAESFNPQAPRGQVALKPLRGSQWEVGAKYVPAQGNWSFEAAAYELHEKNVVREPRPGQIEQTGRTSTRGVEFSAQGRMTPRLDLVASLNLLHTDHALNGVPDVLASAWGRYRFTVARVSGFSVGAGLRYTSSFRDHSYSVPGPRVPAALIGDAMLSWENAHWRLALNANNVTDRQYLAACPGAGSCWWGAGRAVVGTATYRF